MKEPYILFKNIKKARVTSGLSQKDLAKRLGVSDKTVSAYETGRAIPPTPTLAKIAELTGTSLSAIVGIEENNKDDKINERFNNLDKRLSNIEQALIKLIKEK